MAQKIPSNPIPRTAEEGPGEAVWLGRVPGTVHQLPSGGLPGAPVPSAEEAQAPDPPVILFLLLLGIGVGFHL